MMKSDKAFEEYNTSRKELEQMIRRAKRGYEIFLASQIIEKYQAFLYVLLIRKITRDKEMADIR